MLPRLLFWVVCSAALALLYLLARRLSGERLSALVFLALYVAGFKLVSVGSAMRMGRDGASGSKNAARAKGTVGGLTTSACGGWHAGRR